MTAIAGIAVVRTRMRTRMVALGLQGERIHHVIASSTDSTRTSSSSSSDTSSGIVADRGMQSSSEMMMVVTMMMIMMLLLTVVGVRLRRPHHGEERGRQGLGRRHQRDRGERRLHRPEGHQHESPCL